MTKITRNEIIATVCFIAITVAMFFISKIEAVSEWLTRHIYIPMANTFGSTFEHLEFAVFEVFLFLLAAAAVILIAFSIYYFVHKNKERGLRLLTTLFLVVSIVVFHYVSMASTMYNRKPLDVPEETTLLNKDQVHNIAVEYFADFLDVASKIDANEDGSSKCPYTEKEIIELLKKEYDKLNSDYFATHTASPKPVASSYLMNAFSITGITSITSS